MDSKGFTLLEVLLALIFLAFGLLSLLGLLVHQARIEEESTRKVCSAFCAQEKMEELRFGVVTSSLHTRQGDEALERPGGTLYRSWKVSSYETIEGIQEIEVQCHYLWGGKKKGVEIKSLIVR